MRPTLGSYRQVSIKTYTDEVYTFGRQPEERARFQGHQRFLGCQGQEFGPGIRAKTARPSRDCQFYLTYGVVLKEAEDVTHLLLAILPATARAAGIAR